MFENRKKSWSGEGLVARRRTWKKNNDRKGWFGSKAKSKGNNNVSIAIKKGAMWELVQIIREKKKKKDSFEFL